MLSKQTNISPVDLISTTVCSQISLDDLLAAKVWSPEHVELPVTFLLKQNLQISKRLNVGLKRINRAIPTSSKD